MAANIVFPSAEQAKLAQASLGAVVGTQVIPESFEIYNWPPDESKFIEATSFVPSAEEATQSQMPGGALVVFHVPPEFVEV